MNKKLLLIGNFLFDYIAITILFILGLVLVVPFIGINVGISNYFEKPLHERELLDIFRGIKKNFKVICIKTIVLLPLILIAILNINFIKSPKNPLESIIYFLSYLVIFFTLIILMAGPIVIIKMNVTLRQLVYNSLMIAFGNIYYYLLMLALGYLYLSFSMKYSCVLILGPYFVTYAIHYLSSACINNLKFKGGTNV